MRDWLTMIMDGMDGMNYVGACIRSIIHKQLLQLLAHYRSINFRTWAFVQVFGAE